MAMIQLTPCFRVSLRWQRGLWQASLWLLGLASLPCFILQGLFPFFPANRSRAARPALSKPWAGAT